MFLRVENWREKVTFFLQFYLCENFVKMSDDEREIEVESDEDEAYGRHPSG